MVPKIKHSAAIEGLGKYDPTQEYLSKFSHKMTGTERYMLNEREAYRVLHEGGAYKSMEVYCGIFSSVFMTLLAFYNNYTGVMNDVMTGYIVCISGVIFSLTLHLARYRKQIACLVWNANVVAIATDLHLASIQSIIDNSEDYIDGVQTIETAKESVQRVIDII